MLTPHQKKFHDWFLSFKESNRYDSNQNYSLKNIFTRFNHYIYNDLGIRTIASDFDLTMMTKHSGGYIDPLDNDGVMFSKSLSREFNIFGQLAENANISISVVTFSDPLLIPSNQREKLISGRKMIEHCLKESGAEFKVRNCYCFYPKIWQSRSQYSTIGLDAPMPPFKKYHLLQVASADNLLPCQILFIDDDIRNCKQALQDGFIVIHVEGNAGFSLKSASVSFYKNY
ncbi:apicomplexan P36 family [Cryptosporidium sp. chipmunk genotype I]|uniref:apicomplexan P36 family n=1 Tax=Cryptosporidium sp. chipmunk genotype I TaxID=1280935 RepID=UPI003519E2DD|nr:apicomplexan P36 family [Cryptosporidium sp. chipmunk genotype I]